MPYKDTDSATDTWSGKGCCPGQTGHHLLPDAMFRSGKQADRDKALNAWKGSYSGSKPKESLSYSDMPRDKKPTMKCWDNYTEGGSPTICLEGTDNTSGSHGLVHGLTETLMKRHVVKPEMDYTTARSEMAQLISTAYGCDKKCLEAQLDDYYCKAYSCGKPAESCKDKLKDATVTPHSGMPNGGPVTGGSKKD